MPPQTTNFDTWRNLYWANLSGQLYALHIVNDTYFDGGALLKKDTENGAWLWSWLSYTYHQHSATARETMTMEVIPPGPGSAGCVGVRLVRKVRRHWATTYQTFPFQFEGFGEGEGKGREQGAIEEAGVGGVL